MKGKKPTALPLIRCQLDDEVFTCHKCKGGFSHIQGTWLPTGKLIYTDYCTKLPEGTDPRFPKTPVLFFSLRCPRMEMSEDFTCYDCVTNEGEQFIDSNYDVA